MLPAGATRDPETSRFLLFSQDRHASGIVYFSQSAEAAAAVIEVNVDGFYKSEEALRAETSITALRPSRVGVFVSGLRAAFRRETGCCRWARV